MTAGSSAADSLRKNWDAVLEAVKQERRVAWMLLNNASVLSLEDGILTLRFVRDGDLKGFSVSGHDAILKRVLSTGFGLNVTIKGVAGGDPGPGAGSGSGAGARAARSGPPASRPPAARPPAVPPARVPPERVPDVPGARGGAGFRRAGFRRALRRAGRHAAR